MKFLLLVITVCGLVIAGEARKHKYLDQDVYVMEATNSEQTWEAVLSKPNELCIDFKDKELFESESDDDFFMLTIKSDPEGVFNTINTNILSKNLAKKSCFDLEVRSSENIQGFNINAEARFLTDDLETVVTVNHFVSFRGGMSETWNKLELTSSRQKNDTKTIQSTSKSPSNSDNQVQFSIVNAFPRDKHTSLQDLINYRKETMKDENIKYNRKYDDVRQKFERLRDSLDKADDFARLN